MSALLSSWIATFLVIWIVGMILLFVVLFGLLMNQDGGAEVGFMASICLFWPLAALLILIITMCVLASSFVDLLKGHTHV